MKRTYEQPVLREVGSLTDLTRALNKSGMRPDIYSGEVPIVGSIVPAT